LGFGLDCRVGWGGVGEEVGEVRPDAVVGEFTEVVSGFFDYSVVSKMNDFGLVERFLGVWDAGVSSL